MQLQKSNDTLTMKKLAEEKKRELIVKEKSKEIKNYLAALICEDNIVKTYYLLKQTKKEIENEKISIKNKKYSKIFIEKLQENEPAIISLNEKISECAKNYKSGKNINKRAFVKEDILTFVNDKKNKISTRNILGVIKNNKKRWHI